MVRYFDNGAGDASQCLGRWCQSNINGDVKAFHAQFGFFDGTALRVFARLAERTRSTSGSFHLVIGANGLSLLRRDVEHALALARAFADWSITVVSFANALYHPKTVVVEHADSSMSAVVGSANCTQRGMGMNVEAFLALSSQEDDSLRVMRSIIRATEHWRLQPSPPGAHPIRTAADIDALTLRGILGLEHTLTPAAPTRPSSVSGRPSRRALWSIPGASPRAVTQEASEEADLSDLRVPTLQILVAEIPKANTRWNQANFDKHSFEHFFGMSKTSSQLAILRHVEANGTLGQEERRPGVAVKSQNYRLELQAAAGLAYPAGGRPIAVFVKLAELSFRYRLLMPRDQGHAAADSLLRELWRGRSDRMRRVETDTATLSRYWPNPPFGLVPPNANA